MTGAVPYILKRECAGGTRGMFDVLLGPAGRSGMVWGGALMGRARGEELALRVHQALQAKPRHAGVCREGTMLKYLLQCLPCVKTKTKQQDGLNF